MPVRLYDSARKVMARVALDLILSRERVGPILDLGCGPGLIANWLGEGQGFVIHGLDIAPRSIAAAQAAATGANIFAVYDGHNIPYPDGYFATVLCLEVLEHVDQPADLLAEMARVLHPAGRLLLSTPNAQTVSLEGKHHHRRHFTEDELRELVGAAGLRIRTLTHRYHGIGAFIDRSLMRLGAGVVATDTVEDDALTIRGRQPLAARLLLATYDRLVDPIVDRIVWAEYRRRQHSPGASIMVDAEKQLHQSNQTPMPK